MEYSSIENLIKSNKVLAADNILKSNYEDTAQWHFWYSKIMLSKLWFDSALNHLSKAMELDPNNAIYKNELMTLFGRNRHYSNDYYNSGYRRHSRGCSCCCCDDCCCDCNFSCCDLICLDSCCECMGGDLIDCI